MKRRERDGDEESEQRISGVGAWSELFHRVFCSAICLIEQV